MILRCKICPSCKKDYDDLSYEERGKLPLEEIAAWLAGPGNNNLTGVGTDMNRPVSLSKQVEAFIFLLKVFNKPIACGNFIFHPYQDDVTRAGYLAWYKEKLLNQLPDTQTIQNITNTILKYRQDQTLYDIDGRLLILNYSNAAVVLHKKIKLSRDTSMLFC